MEKNVKRIFFKEGNSTPQFELEDGSIKRTYIPGACRIYGSMQSAKTKHEGPNLNTYKGIFRTK